jgi:transcriptional regulator with XRE-family HTH domain
MIRKAREHLNYSIETVAEELGISEGQLLQYELGDSRPPAFQLLALCSVLRVQPTWFFPEIWSADERRIRKVQLEAAARPYESDQIADADQSRGVVEVSFPGDIQIRIGRDFDDALFRRVVAVLRAN